MSIAAILARAKAQLASPPAVAPALRRVRPVDRVLAAGWLLDVVDGWAFWIDDEGFDHFSRHDFIVEVGT